MIDTSRIWSSPNLPTLPAAAARLLELARDPDREHREIISAIKADPVICAKVLRAANSSFFGFPGRVASVDRAVPLLGSAVVTPLVLSFSLSDVARSDSPLGGRFAECWRHSAAQAAAAEVLAEMKGEGPSCEYFTAGLLADLGRLALLKAVPREYSTVLDEVAAVGGHLVEHEASALGTDHVTVGVGLLERWELPAAVTRAAAFHHASIETLKAESTAPDFPLIRAVAVAAAAAEYCCGHNRSVASGHLRLLAAEFYGLDDAALGGFLLRLRERFDGLSQVLSAWSAPLPDPSDLLAEASDQLARLAFCQQAATAEAIARQKLAEQQKREVERQNERLQQQVRHDPLTRLYNRDYFTDALEREIVRCGRSGETVGVLFCDIDHFKQINDEYGHPFGDHVLRQGAAALAGCLRRSDVIARYGGEEFVVLVSTPTEAGLAKVAERLRTRVESEEFLADGRRVAVTVSVGGAFVLPGRDVDGLADRLVAAADASMYDSKRAGRNCVHVRSLLGDSQRRLLDMVTARRFSRWLVNRGAVDMGLVSQVLQEYPTPRRPIGAIARQLGLLAAADVDAVLADQGVTGERFGEIAVRLGLFGEESLAELLALQTEDPRRVAQALISRGTFTATEAEALLDGHARDAVVGVRNEIAAALC